MNSSMQKCFVVAAEILLSLPAFAFAQATVSVTGAESVNLCEANAYTITVTNSGATDISDFVVLDTMPATGFWYLPGASTITSPAGTLTGPAADPVVAMPLLTWDIDALYGSPVTLAAGQSLTITFTMETDCDALSGTDQLTVQYTGEGSPKGDALFITVYPGDIAVFKTPVTQQASIGETVT
jgi:uncharacterized repeat protein (TIGR01451 family)